MSVDVQHLQAPWAWQLLEEEEARRWQGRLGLGAAAKYTYDEGGVRAVLVNAVVRVCPHCGSRMLGLQRANQLTALLVRLLALKGIT